MRNELNTQSLSRLRQELRGLVEDLERVLKVVFGRSPIVKGNVYEMARKCGKPSCACASGALHRSMVLSWSHHGKTRLMSIPPGRVTELCRKSEEYLRVRRVRAQVLVLCKKMVSVIDRIEKLRLEEP